MHPGAESDCNEGGEQTSHEVVDLLRRRVGIGALLADDMALGPLGPMATDTHDTIACLSGARGSKHQKVQSPCGVFSLSR